MLKNTLFKKTVSFILAISILVIMNTSIFATNTVVSRSWTVRYDNNSNIYLKNIKTGEIVVRAFRLDETGKPIDIKLSQYVQVLNNQTVDQNQKQSVTQSTSDTVTQHTSSTLDLPPYITSYYRYEQTYSYTDSGSSVKVTPDVIGPATITYGNSTTVTESFSAAISLNAEAKRVIKGGASFTWNSSASTSTSFGLTYSVPAGKTGYIKFTPYRNVTVGELYEDVFYNGTYMSTLDQGISYGYSPKKLSNGFADGIFALAYN